MPQSLSELSLFRMIDSVIVIWFSAFATPSQPAPAGVIREVNPFTL